MLLIVIMNNNPSIIANTYPIKEKYNVNKLRGMIETNSPIIPFVK